MDRKHARDWGVGAFLLLGFAVVTFLTMQIHGNGAGTLTPRTGYQVTAEFDNIGDLRIGSPVTMAGVKVGQVLGIQLDKRKFTAIVSIRFESVFNEIPIDSLARIQTQGLLGGKYIAITPGAADTYLRNGLVIAQTESAAVLEKLINALLDPPSDKLGDALSADGKARSLASAH
jgi:phospholipid/cholesterol/gamma-HCH transport system substrate-binding protein